MSRRTAFVLGAVVALLIGLYALAGFVLLPALVERQAPALVADRLHAELTIGDTAFNPFLLRFEVHELRLTQAARETPMLTLEGLVVDLEWASLWRRTWAVSALRLHGLDARTRIEADGRLDWAGLLRALEGESQQEQPPPALRIEHASLQGGRLALTDLRGNLRSPSPASVTLGNIAIEAFDITTRPGEQDSPGRYLLSAALPEDGSLRAQGSIVLQPALRSAGELQMTGLDVAAVWPLLRASLGLDLAPPARGLDAKTRYAYAASERGRPALTLEAAELQLTGVALQPSRSEEALLRLEQLTARGGRFDLATRQVAFAEVGLNDGAVALALDQQGRLDWAALGQPTDPPADLTPAQAAEPAKTVPPGGSSWQARIEALQVEGLALHAIDRSRSPALALDVAGISARTRIALDFGPGSTRTQLGPLNARLEAPELALADAARPLLAFETLSLAGASLDTGERRIRIGEITAQGGRVEVELADGEAGLLQALSSGETARADAAPPEPPEHERAASRAGQGAQPARAAARSRAPAAWHYALDQLRATGVALVLRHGAYEPAIEYTAALKEATLIGIASAAEEPMRLDAQLALADGGSLSAEGSIGQTGAGADIALRLDRLPLLPLQPLLASRARLELRSGVLSARTKLELRRGEGKDGFELTATGDATIDTVRIDEAGSKERFLAWRSLNAEGIELGTAPGRLSIREIELQEPGAKLVIAEDRSVNLTQVIRDDAKAEDSAADASAPAATPFEVAIERIRIQRGVLDYTDLSLVLPFSTQVTSIGGSVLGITSARGERARVQAAGQIEPFGSARVSGSLLPFAPTEFLDLRVHMNNVAMPPLSPYTATFAGRKVADGKLWLDLEYRIEDDQLLGENRIRLDDFRLGERVEAPNALDVPLDMAVALLTDSQGRINVAVPVSGNVGDPQFDIGTLLREALGSLLQRIVTAPFRALGRLFDGKEGDGQLARIEFRVGSDALAPPQREKLEEVGRALAERPRLQLAVNGTYAPERDTQALRRQAARHALARALGDEPAPGEALGLIAFESERTQRALEMLLVQQAGEQALRELRAEPREPAATASRPQPGSPKSGSPSEDLYRAMFQRLARSFPLPDAAVQRLAARRADAIRDYLIGKAGAPAERVKIGPIEPAEEADGRTVSAKLTLDAAAVPATAANAQSGAASR